MKRDSRKRIAEAFKVIDKYHQSLVERMASELLEHREDFENPFPGSAETLLEKYYHLFSCLSAVSSELAAYLPQERKAQPSVELKPLGKDQFRCFRCRSIIDPGSEACSNCGWTWG